MFFEKRKYSLFLALICLGIASNAYADPMSNAEQMSEAALTLISTLADEQRKTALFSIEADDRATWSNLPIFMVQPGGLLIRDMSDAQRQALHALLRASMSSQGYNKAAGIIWLDDMLREIDQRALDQDAEAAKDPFRKAMVATRSSGNYAFAIYGEPGDGDWGWKLAGHHLAMNFTVSDDRISFTPTFFGSNPMAIESGPYAGRMVLPHEGQRGIDLMLSLTAEQKKSALIHSEVASDVFEGPGRRASLDKFEGLRAGELSDEQMQLLRLLVLEYIGNVDHEAAAAQLKQIENAGWEQLWFSWRGPVDATKAFYYRVHGPRLLIEYNRQNANHDHSVMRDPENDYGEDWLERHYEEHHPTLQEAIQDSRRRAEQEYGQ